MDSHRTLVILALLPILPDRLPTREGSAALGPWKDMTFIAHGLYLDHDRNVALDHRNSGQRLQRGGGDSCALVARDVVGAVVLVTAVMTTAATVTEVEVPAGAEALVDMVRKGGE